MVRTSLRVGVALTLVCGFLVPGRSAGDDAPSSSKASPPWTRLFNGRDLAGWEIVLSGSAAGEDPDRIVQVADDSIHIYRDAPAGTEQPFGYIRSSQAYSYYRLRFQYKWGEKRYAPRAQSLRDAGALYHVTEGKSTHGIWPVCIECQVQEGDTGDLITVDTRCTTYVDPATADDEYPTFRDPSQGGVRHPNDWYVNASRTLDRLEEWNDVEILVCGSQGAVHFVNGEINHRIRDIEAPFEGGWKSLSEGKIAFQIEGAEIFYRQIEICVLTPAEARDAIAKPQPSHFSRTDGLAPGGKTGLDAISVPPGFVVELVADSNLVQHPMMACLDEQGRLFLSESDGVNRESIPQLLAERPHRAIMLEDQDHDGVYDKRSNFAEGLVLPNGAQWYDGALYVCSAPYLWKFRDRDGDGRSDEASRIAGKFNFDGMSSAFHGPVMGPDGRFYWSGGQHGWRLESAAQIVNPQSSSGKGGLDEDLAGPWTTTAPGAFSCWPDGSDPEVQAFGGVCNPVETAFTELGETLGTVAVYQYVENLRRDAVVHWIDGGVFNLAEKNYAGRIRTGADLKPVSYRGHAAPAGIARYRSGAFGPEYTDNFFFAEFNTHKIYRLIVERDGATFRSRDEVFLSSSDPDAHFTDVFEDADGSLLVLDTGGWFRHGCPTSQIAKPTILGAVYRIRQQDAGPMKDPRGADLSWDAMAPAELTALLDDPRFSVRDRAVAALAKGGEQTLPALAQCLRSGSVDARVQAVWALTRTRSDAANELLRGALADPQWKVQLAAARSVCLSRDSASRDMLIELLAAKHPAVRREAATALGRLGEKSAVPAILAAGRSDGDRFGDHALTLALIRIGDDQTVAAGLASNSPDVRRIALVALDQMKSPLLTREGLAATLDSGDKALEEAALAVLANHPAWADEIADRLAEWLAEPRPSVDQQARLRGAIRALHASAAVQDRVAQSLKDDDVPAATRQLVLEAISLVESSELPAAWLKGLGRCLASGDPATVGQAVAVIAERELPGFGDSLSELATDVRAAPSLRIAAASAALSGLAATPEPMFDFLIDQCRTAAASFDRLAAAQALGRARLSRDQLERIVAVVAESGPIELPELVKPIETNGDPTLGAQLVDALGKSPGTSSLSAESLSHLLDAFPEEVRRRGEPLVAAATAGVKDRGAKLQAMVERLAAGDADRGRDVFYSQRASCSACHRVGDQGGNVGPNLSKIGEIRAHRDLVEAILFPSASFAREFEPYTVLTDQGKAYAGVVSRKTVQAVYLRGADRSEVRIDRDRIEEIQPSSVSIMPQGIDQVLGEEDLRHLVAFLQACK